MSALILMSVLLLAFFSRALLNRQIAFSSTNLAKADLMARASLDFVIGEIRQEIESDSAITTSNGFTLLQPLTSASRIPQRSGIAGADANGALTLAKVTAPGVSLGGGVVTASDDSISQAGGGSRHFVSAQRWFGSGGPSLGSQTNVPTWIYLTRGQGISTAPLVEDAKNRASGSYVNGRFACTVYDVSGLLNANVAGFPTAMTNQAATKTSAAYADLTAISTNFTAADVQQFVAWRNPLASASASRFAKWATGVSTNTSDATDALLLRVARGGHLQVASGENAFLSRRDLLRTTNSSVAFSSAALSGVTHFSRTVNAPIWTPPFNSTNTPNYFGGSGTVAVAYAGNADAPAATNRNVPNVRFSFSGTVNRHADDGSVTPVAVRAGQPLVGRRFSLAKLAWLTYKGPSATLPASDPQYNAAGTAAAISAAFVEPRLFIGIHSYAKLP